MNEKDLKDLGLKSLSERELSVSGGINWIKAYRLVKSFFEIAEKIEKYLPRFRQGFKRGWEAA